MRFKTFMESTDTSSPAFKQWFGKSKVVDAAGNPLVVYHATDKNFDVFDTTRSEMGSHFGTAEQAGSFEVYGKKAHGYYLSIRRPLRLIDKGQWELDNVLDQLTDKGLILGNVRYDRVTIKQVQDIIRKNGYDGIVYTNRREGVNNTEPEMSDWEQWADDAEFAKKYPDAKDSFIAFYPWQIKSVNNKGTWNKNNPNINESAKSDIIAYLELTPSALQPIMDKYATATAGYSVKDGKTVGIHKKTREIMGRKLWEDMTYDERRSEVLSAINDDLKAADKESAGLDALPKDKVNYYLQRATDFLDPMSLLYKMLLKDMGATITPTGGVKLPKHLVQYIKTEEE